jgi:ABC-type multidrug transport system ATPase subunit
MQFTDTPLFQGAEFLLRKGDKAAIVGPNGHGKTTLLKIIAGELKPITGTVQFGHEVRMGYYAQVHEELRKLGEPLHEHLHQLHHQKAVKDVRGSLGLMLFEGDEQKKKLSALSGGEMARFVFADLMLQKPNFLVLDEPTNHLDIEGIEALEDALAAFEGTVLMVSHDRAFIKKVCNRVFELKDGTLQELNAGVRALDGMDGSEEVKPLTARQKAEAAHVADTNSNYNDRKKQKSDAGKAQTRVKKLEQEIAQHESLINELDALFGDGDRLQTMAPDELRAKTEERAKLQKELEERLAEWESLAS